LEGLFFLFEVLSSNKKLFLAKKEGIFCGTSSGMNVAAAIQISKELGPKSRVVTVACDTGLKYLSEGLFDD